MKKINVIGTSGSGKSTFSKALAKSLGYSYIEMDAVFWGKDWYWPGDAEFFSKLESSLNKDSWVLDGNYTRTIPIKWKDVDTIIWIDFSYGRTLFQAVRRALSRSVSQEELWPGTGNKESFRKLFSKESIVLWTIKTYDKNKKRNALLADNPDYAHIDIVRLKSPKECKRYLEDTL